MKRMALVIKRPLHPRDMRRFGIQAALEREYDVRVVDVSDVLHPNLDNSRPFVPDGVEVRTPADQQAMLSEFRALAGFDLIAPLIVSHHLSQLVFIPMRALSRLDVPLLLMGPLQIPVRSIAEAEEYSSHYFLRRVRDMEPLTSLLARVPPRWMGVRQADYIVYGSAQADCPTRLVGPKTRRIFAHTWDYELLLEHMAEPFEEKEQAVFLDQYIPFHPDAIAVGAKQVDPRRYYGNLNQLFERIERHHGLDVVIAAHPRADYSDKPWAFPGRRIVTGETTRMIAESRLVLAHYSLALHQAAALGKPIMLLVSHALLERNSVQSHNYHAFACAVGAKLHSLDNPDDVDVESCFSLGVYDIERYIADYLRHPKAGPPRPLWDIIFEELQHS